MLAAALVLAVLGIFAVWANRQVLNADNWANTSSAMLENPAIRTQISDFLVDQVYANTDVNAQVAAALPPRLKPLAGPAAGGLRNLAERGTNEALGRPRFQQAWKEANRITAQQVIDVAKNDSKAVTKSGSAVVLDLRVVLTNITKRLGLPGKLVGKIPPKAGQIKIMSSKQVDAVQGAATLLQILAFLLPAAALGLLAGAVYLSEGRRRQVLLLTGINLIVAGFLVLIVRRVAGDRIVDSLAKTDAVKPAAEAAWSIGTRLLRDAAQAAIIAAIPVVFAALLAGPSRWATSCRRFAAPYMRDRPDVVYGAVGGLVLLVIVWGPIPATRRLIPVLIMIGLVALGIRALREQTAQEFPDAHVNGGGAISAQRLTPKPTGNGARLEQLERLSALHDSGALSDDEFASEKEHLT